MFKKIIIGPAYPLRGGISESNQSLHNYFKKSTDNSLIISYSLQYPRFLFPGKKQVVDGPFKKSNTILNLINTLNPFSWIKTVKLIIKEQPHYVIVRYWHPYFAICLSFIISKIRRNSIPIIAWIDNVNPHESVPFQRFLTACFLKFCDAFMVMSNAVKDDLTQYKQSINKKIIVSSHPIYTVFGPSIEKKQAKKNIGIIESSIQNNDKYILFFGIIRKYKGLDLLLDVMGSKKVKEMNLKLIIAGEFYDSKKKYINKIRALDLKDSILLHDYYIKNEDVVNYFCATDIVVQPYLSATQSGVSMVAYNFNKPLILTKVGGLSEYVNHKIDGYLVNPNVESIVTALEDYYANNRESEFRDSIKKKKGLYSWQNLADEFDNLYKEINNE